MIRLDQFDQGSFAWLQARAGIPTASQFHRIITPKTMKASEQAVGYRNHLIAERLLGESLADDHNSDFMARGSEFEDAARSWYEMQRDVDLETTGLVLSDDRRIGCSPDGLISEDGGLELKVPSAAVHMGYLLDGVGDKYRCQVQGSLLVTGRSWWDFMSYHPMLPPVLIRVQPDADFLKLLGLALNTFCDSLDASMEILAERGIVPLELAL